MFIFLEIANWSKIRVLRFIKFDSKTQSHTKFSTIVFFESYEHTRTAVCTWIVAFNVQDIDFPWEPRALAPDFRNYLAKFSLNKTKSKKTRLKIHTSI